MSSVSLVNGHIDPDTSRMTDEEKIRYLNKCEDREQTVVVIWKVTEQKPDKITIGDVVDIINRQQATIKTLRNCVEQHHIIRKDGKSPLSLLTAEIKSEAIKEFWSRLQGIAYQSSDWSHGEHPMVVELDDAEEIYEEMVGEDK
jgi:hypothetical protein